jgi:hypothetical protein
MKVNIRNVLDVDGQFNRSTGVNVGLAEDDQSGDFRVVWHKPNPPQGMADRRDAESLEGLGHYSVTIAISDGSEGSHEAVARHAERRARIIATGVILTSGERLDVIGEDGLCQAIVAEVGYADMPIFVSWAEVLSVAAKAAADYVAKTTEVVPQRTTRR